MRAWLSHLPLPLYAPNDGGGAAAPVVVETVAAPAPGGEPPPVAEPVAVPAPAAEPAAPAPAAEPAAPVAGEPVVNAHAEPTLLEKALVEEPAKKADGEPDKKEEKPAGDKPAEAPVQPAEPAPAEPAKAPEEPVVAAAPEPPVYDFKFPDGIKVDDGQLKPVTEIFAKHNVSPEVGQELIDLHANSMQLYAQHIAQEQHRAFRDLRSDWVKEVLADPELGGAGHKTAMAAVARVREMGVREADIPAFNHFLVTTGAGDNPQFLRMMLNLSKYLDEPAPPSVIGAPPPNAGARPGKRTMADIYKTSDSRRSQ